MLLYLFWYIWLWFTETSESRRLLLSVTFSFQMLLLYCLPWTLLVEKSERLEIDQFVYSSFWYFGKIHFWRSDCMTVGRFLGRSHYLTYLKIRPPCVGRRNLSMRLHALSFGANDLFETLSEEPFTSERNNSTIICSEYSWLACLYLNSKKSESVRRPKLGDDGK